MKPRQTEKRNCTPIAGHDPDNPFCDCGDFLCKPNQLKDNRDAVYEGPLYMGTWTNQRKVYVSQLPARKGSKRALRDGVDWGYSYHEPGWRGNDTPLLLTRYWQRRFCADMRRVRSSVHSIVPSVKAGFYPDHVTAR